MSKTNYSSIPEVKIISSFKRFVNEKLKNSSGIKSPSIIPPNISDGQQTPIKDESTTFQSQIISSYYNLDDAKQEEFWNSFSTRSNNPEQYYYDVLTKLAEQFGISRNSDQLQNYLLDQVVYAYNDCGDKIYIKEIIRFDENQHVALGVMSKGSPNMCSPENKDGQTNKWIVKWNSDPDVGEELTTNAFDKWEKIATAGASIPKILTNFYILDFPVIVMEYLDQLDQGDYNQKLVLSVVSFIEKTIPIGVNNNIKPSNILKKVSDGSTKYYVADVDKMTTDENAYGYKRFSWSPDWASQVIDGNTITTVKNDLLEFGYTLNYLSKIGGLNDATAQLSTIEQIRILDMPEELKAWMDRVRIIDEQNIKLIDFIDLKKLAMDFPKTSEKYLVSLCET